MTQISRRRLFRYAAALGSATAVGGVALASGACRSKSGGSAPGSGLSADAYNRVDPRRADRFTRPLALPRTEGGMLGDLDISTGPVTLGARPERLEFLKGTPTDALVYRAEANGRTYTNPVLRVKRGASVSPRLMNGLDEPTIIHWHGLKVDWRQDGHPRFAVPGGSAYDYQFTVQDRGGTYWYHPHPDMRTGVQTYRGMAGFLIVDDDDEQRLRERLDLAFGVTDIPLLIQDRRFGKDGSLSYVTSPMEQFQGVSGDVMLVNQTIGATLDVETRAYRLRLLNGSNARVYRLAVMQAKNALPMALIGTDGGLLPTPVPVTEVFLGPAERADVLVDLRTLSSGDVLYLKSLPFDPMHNEMSMMGGTDMGQGNGGMGGMQMGGGVQSRVADGEEFFLLKLNVRRKVRYDLAVPTTLSDLPRIDTTGATTRPVTLSASGMQWLINGERFDDTRELFRIPTGATEIWEIKNVDSSMPHPMHLHGFQFQVLERRGSPQQMTRIAVDLQGRVATDLGWKDTVLVWPGETVRIAATFAHTFSGEQTYLFHCHVLEHEDAGMMVNYRIA